MCKKRNSTEVPYKNQSGHNAKVDNCLVGELISINLSVRYKSISSCCGHGKYPKTIIVKDKKGLIFELHSKIVIPRKRRFYIKNKENGLYHIPEVS